MRYTINKKFTGKFLMGAISAAISFSCTDNYLEINKDPYGVSDKEMMMDGYVIRASLMGLADGVISSDVNTAQFTDALLGSTCGGYLSHAVAAWYTSGCIGNFNPTDNWTNVFMASKFVIPVIYTNYNKLRQITDNEVILAVGDVMKVAAMHRITDAYGPIPYSKIGQDGDISVPYDSQEDVYSKMLQELTDAVNVLTANRGYNFPSTADVIFAGNTEKWIKFANSLKLRLAMRISYANPELSKKMAEEAVAHEIGVMDSNDDNAFTTTFGTDGNPLNVCIKYNMYEDHDCTTSGDSHAAADIICFMNGYNDNRREKYFTKSEFAGVDYIGLRRGIVIPAQDVCHQYCGVNISTDSPIYWMNAAEVAFLKAEAAAVFGYDMGGDAKTFYEQGIRLSFGQWGASGADAYLADSASKPAEYSEPAGGSNNPIGAPSTVTIAWNDSETDVEIIQERIITQKWIANWLIGNEAWADYRRTGYPRLFPATEAGNRSGGIVDSKKGARRIPYPSAERINNAENYRNALVLLGGEDNMGTDLWFAQKKK